MPVEGSFSCHTVFSSLALQVLVRELKEAELLCEALDIPAVSTGAIFRAHAAANDELGQLAASYTARANWCLTKSLTAWLMLA